MGMGTDTTTSNIGMIRPGMYAIGGKQTPAAVQSYFASKGVRNIIVVS